MIQPISRTAPSQNRREAISRIGELDRTSVTLFVHSTVLDEILDFSEMDMRREIGGFLIGSYCKDLDKSMTFVELEHFLPATDVRSQSASLTFTHETWATANREVQLRYPDHRIIGWHHTHPGLGVFLSAYDLFIHRNFFGCDWQIAMVVDPQRQEFAFYQWRESEIQDCGFVVVGTSTTVTTVSES